MLIMYAAKAVEYGASESVFAAPLHPYTAMLTDSLPTIGDDPRAARHSGSAAEPLAGAQGLPLRRPLPTGDGALPGRGAGAGRAPARALRGPATMRGEFQRAGGDVKLAVILRTEGLNKVYRLGGLTRGREIRALDHVNLNIESDHPVDHQHRGRVGERQDHAGQNPAAAGRAELRQGDDLRQARRR